MNPLTAEFDIDAFWARLRRASRRALLLDYDGTIAPFRRRRDEATLHPAVIGPLNSILGTRHTRIVLVSGRAIDDLLPMISGLCSAPEIWGSHGWERQTCGGLREIGPLPAQASAALAAAKEEARQYRFADRCEFKPASLAVHWRGISNVARGALLEKVRDAWASLSRPQHDNQRDAPRCGERQFLEWHEFDGGIELRVPGRNKGHAVRAVAAELGADSLMAYAGDDLTDEDAFAALGDEGLSILVRKEFRKTSAKVWLQSCQQLAEFLTRWHHACTTVS